MRCKHKVFRLFVFSWLALGGSSLAFVSAEAGEKAEFQWSVYGDAYYGYNFIRPKPVTPISSASSASSMLPASTNTYRAYDLYHNQLTLNLAELSLAARKGEVGVVADLSFGPSADFNANQTAGSSAAIDEISKHIGQFVISYQPVDSRWSFDLGKMYTHVGLETAKAKDNWQYSRSWLYSYGIPIWHLGMRVGYEAVPKELALSLYVYNSWNSIYDNNTAKTLGFQGKWTAGPWLFVYNVLAGPEQTLNDSHWKILNELNASWNGGGSWSLATDFLYGTEKKATVGNSQIDTKWLSWTFAFKHAFSEKTYFSPRYEYYRDYKGYTLSGGDQSLHGITLTLAHRLAKALEGRFETRMDLSNRQTFRTTNALRKSQASVLFGLLANF